MLQRVLGLRSQVAFAAELGISPTRLGNMYNGAMISRQVAFKLREKVPGLTLDWIWFGYWAGIPIELAQRLQKLMEEEPPGAS